MQRRRVLMGMQQNVPPSGYRFIEYARADTSISGGARIDLPFGFDKTDDLIVKASCESFVRDKFLIAPSVWNDSGNRFAVVGGPYADRFGVGYGSVSTVYGDCYWSISVIQRDDKFHLWAYSAYRFSLDDISVRLDVSAIQFGAGTKNLSLFYGYNSNTSGKIAYYRHKKADGTTYNIVPIQHKITGVVEMYDTVSKTIMPRTGTLYPPEE